MLSDKPGSYDFTPARVISGRGDFHFGERADSPLRTIGGEAVKDRIPEQGGGTALSHVSRNGQRGIAHLGRDLRRFAAGVS